MSLLPAFSLPNLTTQQHTGCLALTHGVGS